MAGRDKKNQGGERKTPRTPVQFPKSWMKLVRELAAGRQQPALWFLISLVIEEAKKQGKDHPLPPWEEDLVDDDPEDDDKK